jgi:hypothetical protein
MGVAQQIGPGPAIHQGGDHGHPEQIEHRAEQEYMARPRPDHPLLQPGRPAIRLPISRACIA